MGQIDIRVREPATPKPNLANRFGVSDCVIASSEACQSSYGSRQRSGYLRRITALGLRRSCTNRSVAIRKLMEIGLEAVEKKPKGKPKPKPKP
jgi:hypothetical protein